MNRIIDRSKNILFILCILFEKTAKHRSSLYENPTHRFREPIVQVLGDRVGTRGSESIRRYGIRNCEYRHIGSPPCLHARRRIFDDETVRMDHRKVTLVRARKIEFTPQPQRRSIRR
jgi:hypothetical protein